LLSNQVSRALKNLHQICYQIISCANNEEQFVSVVNGDEEWTNTKVDGIVIERLDKSILVIFLRIENVIDEAQLNPVLIKQISCNQNRFEIKFVSDWINDFLGDISIVNLLVRSKRINLDSNYLRDLFRLQRYLVIIGSYSRVSRNVLYLDSGGISCHSIDVDPL
jgi:hypothetical protein